MGENVPGLYTSTGRFTNDSGGFYGEILSDLAALGYVTGWCCYGAVDVGAPHRRDRVFIVAHAASGDGGQPIVEPTRFAGTLPEADGERFRNQSAGRGSSMAYPSIKGLEGAITVGAASADGQPEQRGDVGDADTESEPCDGLHNERGNSQFREYRGCSCEGGEYWAVS